uniref:Uncharacterized protein n=1 Tax=Oryza nivara TaxID=4536 RepID=A0A0E0I8P4_ORYNI
MASYFIDPTTTWHRFPSPSRLLLRRRRFPTSGGEQPGCGCALAGPGRSGTHGRSLRGIGDGNGGRPAGSFSSGHIDGALAAGFRGEQVATQSVGHMVYIPGLTNLLLEFSEHTWC